MRSACLRFGRNVARRQRASTRAWRAGVRSFSSGSESAEFELSVPFKTHRLDDVEIPTTVTATKDEMLGYYKEMTYYRKLEIAADNLYKQQFIRGFCHLYDGQEAIVAGMEAALTRNDSVITAYRDHCHQIARGDTGERVMAELLGKETGCSRGKGGSMHMYLPENNFYGGNGIVGAQIPVGAGIAFAHKYRGDGGVCVAAMGDGASNQGQVYEAANMASLWKLPVIFLVENNLYGMGTAVNRSSASTKYYTRGDYVPGVYMDGMDVLAMKQGFEFCKEYCSSGQGPLFVEARTYRYHGHSMSDPGVSYRSRDEVKEVRKTRDPILLTSQRIIEQGWATAKELKAIDKDIKKKVEADVQFAKDSQLPDDKELYTDIYWGAPPPVVKAVERKDDVIA